MKLFRLFSKYPLMLQTNLTQLHEMIDAERKEAQSQNRELLLLRAHYIDAEQRLASLSKTFAQKENDLIRDLEATTTNCNLEVNAQALRLGKALNCAKEWQLCAILVSWREFVFRRTMRQSSIKIRHIRHKANLRYWQPHSPPPPLFPFLPLENFPP